MSYTSITNNDVEKLYHLIVDAGPILGRVELSQEQREVLENKRLIAEVKKDLKEYRAKEKIEQLAQALEIPLSNVPKGADLLRLHRAIKS